MYFSYFTGNPAAAGPVWKQFIKTFSKAFLFFSPPLQWEDGCGQYRDGFSGAFLRCHTLFWGCHALFFLGGGGLFELWWALLWTDWGGKETRCKTLFLYFLSLRILKIGCYTGHGSIFIFRTFSLKNTKNHILSLSSLALNSQCIFSPEEKKG